MMIMGVRIVDENGRCPAPKYVILRSSYLFSNVIEDVLLMFARKDMDGVGLTTSGTQVMSVKDIDEKRMQIDNRLSASHTLMPSKAKIPHSYTAPVFKIVIALCALPVSIITAGTLLDLIHRSVESGAEIPHILEYILEIISVPISFISAILFIRGIAEIMFIRDERRNLPSPEEQEKLECERCKATRNKVKRIDFHAYASCENNASQNNGEECSLDCRSVDYKTSPGEPSYVSGDGSPSDEEKVELTPFKLFEKKILTPDKTLTSYKSPLMRLAIFYGIMGVCAILFSLLWQITRLGSDVAIALFLIMFPVMFILVYCEARLFIRIIIEMVSVWKNRRAEKRVHLSTRYDEDDIPEND